MSHYNCLVNTTEETNQYSVFDYSPCPAQLAVTNETKSNSLPILRRFGKVFFSKLTDRVYGESSSQNHAAHDVPRIRAPQTNQTDLWHVDTYTQNDGNKLAIVLGNRLQISVYGSAKVIREGTMSDKMHKSALGRTYNSTKRKYEEHDVKT